MPEYRVLPGTQIRFRCGDVVALADCERHEGVVVAVFGNTARVSWSSLSGAKEDVSQEALVLVSRRAEPTTAHSQKQPGPKTIVESPRRRLERELAERRKQ